MEFLQVFAQHFRIILIQLLDYVCMDEFYELLNPLIKCTYNGNYGKGNEGCIITVFSRVTNGFCCICCSGKVDMRKILMILLMSKVQVVAWTNKTVEFMAYRVLPVP